MSIWFQLFITMSWRKENWLDALLSEGAQSIHWRWPLDLSPNNYSQIKRLHVWITQQKVNWITTSLKIASKHRFVLAAEEKRARERKPSSPSPMMMTVLVYLCQEHRSIKIKLCTETPNKTLAFITLFVPNNCAYTIACCHWWKLLENWKTAALICEGSGNEVRCIWKSQPLCVKSILMIPIFIISFTQTSTTYRRKKGKKTSIIMRWFSGNRFCSGRWRCPFCSKYQRRNKHKNGSGIDAAMDIVWPFVGYLRRRFGNKRSGFNAHSMAFGLFFCFVLHSHQNEVKKPRRNKRKRYKQKGLVAVGFLFGSS